MTPAKEQTYNGLQAITEIIAVLQVVSEYLFTQDRLRSIREDRDREPSPMYARVSRAHQIAKQLGRTMSMADATLPEGGGLR